MKKKYWLSVFAYLAATFIIAAGWHLVLFKSVYAELAIFSRKDPLIPLGLSSMLLQGLVLSWLYPRVQGSGSPVHEGLRFGLIMGILMATIGVLAEAGKQEVTSLSTWLLLESSYYLLQFGAVGLLVGVIHGRKQGSPSPGGR